MASPVVHDDFPALSSTADVCTRLSQLLTLWSRFGDFLGWLLNSDGEISDTVLEGVADRTVPIGTILMYASHTPPSDKWLTCTGQAVSRATYADLFNRIGTTYGVGDASSTFNLPDFRDRFPVGTGASYAPNASGGEASHILTIAELPSHNHSNDQYSHILKPTQAGSITGSDTSNSDTEANVTTSAAMSSVGSGSAHENRPPYRAVPFIIKVK